MSKLSCQHLLSINDLTHDDVMLLMGYAAFIENKMKHQPKLDLMSGKLLSSLFFESSTRTRLSFESAMQRLGGGIMSVDGVFSSTAKGESMQDMGRVVSGYSDVIVVRHSEVGSVANFAEHATVPVINAGDGTNQHPTQALLDLYTILSEKESLSGLTLGFMGDLRHARTVKSLVPLLKGYDVSIVFISHPDLKMTDDVKQMLQDRSVRLHETDDLVSVLPDLDVLYVTRLQEERFEDTANFEEYQNRFCITPQVLASAKADLSLMHPLPRRGEIHLDCDSDPRAAYFRQANNGLIVRAALLYALTS